MACSQVEFAQDGKHFVWTNVDVNLSFMSSWTNWQFSQTWFYLKDTLFSRSVAFIPRWFHCRVSTWLVTASWGGWWILTMACVTSTPADSTSGAQYRVSYDNVFRVEHSTGWVMTMYSEWSTVQGELWQCLLSGAQYRVSCHKCITVAKVEGTLFSQEGQNWGGHQQNAQWWQHLLMLKS